MKTDGWLRGWVCRQTERYRWVNGKQKGEGGKKDPDEGESKTGKMRWENKQRKLRCIGN